MVSHFQEHSLKLSPRQFQNTQSQTKEDTVPTLWTQVDIWAIGCLAYELLAGYSPFDGENHEDITTRILGGKMIKLPTAVSCSEDVLSFITARARCAAHAAPRPRLVVWLGYRTPQSCVRRSPQTRPRLEVCESC